MIETQTQPTVPVSDRPTEPQASHGMGAFRYLWAGQSVSLLGDQLMIIALPLLAVITLHHSAAEAVLLPFGLYFPFLLLGLPAGAIADRSRKRRLMIVCDGVQLIVFMAIAVLAAERQLPFPLLLVLVGVAGCATVLFQVSYTSYLPHLISEEAALHKGNSRLFLSESLSQTLGPMAAGPIIAFLGPIAAVAANASTFLVSILTLSAIRHPEPRQEVAARPRGWMRTEVREGLRFALRHPLLQPVLVCGSVYVLFLSMVEAIMVLYCRDVLHLSALKIGIVIGAAAAGFPIGNIVSGRLRARVGVARTLVCGACVSVAGLVSMAVAGNVLRSAAGLVVASVVHGLGEGTFGPTALTLRQTETPANLLGRVNSIQRFLIWGAIPLGSLLASAVTAFAGLTAAMWVGGLGTVMCLPPLVRRGILQGLRRGRPGHDADHEGDVAQVPVLDGVG